MLSPWPHFSKAEIKSVTKVLESGKVNYLFGELGQKFEERFSTFSNSKYSLAVANGTLALDLSLRALNLQPGDEVLVTSRSYIATASSIALLGGVPIWCDVDLNSQNICLEEITKKSSKKTKGIICVHFAGFPCDMKSIMAYAKLKNLFVIEDCAQAHGASINGRSVGSFGDISTWSFCNDKIMTLGGEGGMITTNSAPLYRFMASFNNHGKNLKKYFTAKKLDSFPYMHESLGSNYRMTEMQSAIGICQLEKMESWSRIRERNAGIYINAVKDIELINAPVIPTHFKHAWYKLYLTLNPQLLKKSFTRTKIIDELNHQLVPCSFGGSGQMYQEHAFFGSTYKKDGFLLNASFLEKNSLMLLVHPTISREESIRRAQVLKSVLQHAQK
ncbi:DegT/DnrJ/EryC1/StrS family aminotransferase [Gammaproteobacteria bacterium]|nr:DegT/DnrJ/EryC1/StrS family aminotransferase [Gammaproteobacteria bacterium]